MRSAEVDAYLEGRRSHSYDESYLYHAETEGYHNNAMRQGPPTAALDDLALAARDGRSPNVYRTTYEPAPVRPLMPLVSDNDSLPFDQESDDHIPRRGTSAAARNGYSFPSSPPRGERSVRPFDEDSATMDDDELQRQRANAAAAPSSRSSKQPVIQSRVHGPHRVAMEGSSDNHHDLGTIEADPTARFRKPPVRVSKPALDAGLEEEEDAYSYANPPDVHRITSETASPPMSPGSSAKASLVAHPSESPTQIRIRGIEESYEEFGIGNGSISSAFKGGNTTEEEDSLFDFEHGGGRAPRLPALPPKSPVLEGGTGDETSEDDRPGASALTLRTQEAWKRKAMREKKAKSDNHVAFTETNPTVHRYAEYTAENSTLAGNSLNSEYTKSMESEVEDAIKDIFMIGSGTSNNPGRRKLKHRPDFRRRLRGEETGGARDDDTLDSFEETADNQKFVVEGLPRKHTPPREERKEADGDPLLGAWTLVESGLQAMGAALGIEGGGADDDTATYDGTTVDEDSQVERIESREVDMSPPIQSRSKEKKVSRREARKEARKEARRSPPVDDSLESTTITKSTTTTPVGSSSPPENEASLLDYWSGAILGKNSKEAEAETKVAAPVAVPVSPATSPKRIAAITKDESRSITLDKDLRLIEMAIESARSYHKLKGVAYDESEVDIVTDIKFIVVDLSLPLGLIFQENESGCWVTKVLTDGSAIKKSIHVGDQLAAIDGKSAIRLKVEDIALAIRQKKSRPFELTFLRYIGPLRPAAGGEPEEEGYEIRARMKSNEDQTNGRNSRRRKSKSSSSPKKSGDDNDTRRFRFFGGRKK